MSASVYANPYTYKPPPPKIHYPGLFDGLNNITFRYILDSKILALAVLILGASTFVNTIIILVPFWFKLVLDPVQGTFGSLPIKRELTINSGLFYLREDQFDNTVFLDSYTDEDVVPTCIQAGQVFSVTAACILVCSLGGSVILMFRRFGSVPALLILAGATTLAGVFQVLVILCCAYLLIESSCDPYDGGDGCNYDQDNLAWHMIPIYSQIYRVEPRITPYVQPNWAFFIAIIGALITCAAAVMLWIEAFMTSRNLRQIRYQQLKEHRDPYEKEYDPYGGKTYRYEPPFQGGPNTFGMQPVMGSGPMYGGPPSDPGAYIPPTSFPLRPPSPGFGHRYDRPSETSSVSGPIVSREIDL